MAADRFPVAPFRLNVSPGCRIEPLIAAAAVLMLRPESAANPRVVNSPITAVMPSLLMSSVVTFAGCSP